MDGRYFKTDSKFSLKKCAGGCHGGVDRITELPDENGVDRISLLPDGIIIFILSFLSLREATSTSVLSSRWSDLWKHTPNLNFNTELIKIKPRMQIPWELRSCDMEKCKYIQMVNSVLQSHKSLSLKKFKISLYVNKSAECAVTKWLEYLFSRRVESLELDFLCEYEMDMVSLEVSLRDSKVCLPQTHDLILFKSLKRLCLKCLKVSGEDIDLFLRNCPLLKRLSIHHTLLTSDVVVCGTTLVLKHLDIYSCSGEISIKVSSPKLTWLRVNTISKKKLLLENLPKLIGAAFTCTSQSPDDAKHFASAVFCCISRLKFLYLTLDYPKVFLANSFPQMPNLKRLEISYSGVYEHGLLPVTALIWASPRLQEFKLEFMNLARDPTSWREGLTNVTRHPHRHLKAFKFEGFCVDAADHIELVTYISNNCVALQRLIISCFPFYESAADLTDSQQIAQAVADRDRAKQLLQAKLPHHIKLHVTI